MIEHINIPLDEELHTGAASRIERKLNEVIDVMNDLLITHPRIKEQAEMKRSFEQHMTEDSKNPEFPNND